VAASIFGIGLGLSPVPFYTIGMLAPELNKAFGWEFGAIMTGLMIMTFGVLIASTVVGHLGDRFGVRRVALISMVLFALSFMAFSLSNGSIVLFYVNWAVMALLGAGTLPVTWTRAVNNYFDVRKGLALGLSLIGTGIFGFLIKPITAWLIATYGWRTTYLVIGLMPLLIAFPIAFFAFHDVGAKSDDVEARRKASAARQLATPGLTLGQAFKSWRYWVIAFSFVFVSFGVGGPIPNMENILKVAGFTGSDIVSMVALIGLSVIVGRIAGGWLIDRFWAPGVAFVMLSLPAMSCWLMAGGGMSVPAAAMAIFLIGFAAGVEYDLMAFLVARYFGMKSYSAIYGSLYGFFALGAGIGPVAFGKVFDKTGSYGPVLGTSAALLMIGAVSLLFLGRYQRYER
jgi:predicted MFS family arabinose efflux permease